MTDYDQTIKKFDQMLGVFYRHLSSKLNDRIVGGITLSQLFILNHIALDANTVSDLATKLKISPPAVSRLVDQLVKLDYVTRVISQKDRRITVLELTHSGKQILRDNSKLRYEALKKILSCFTEEEIETLLDIIERLLIRLESEKF